MAARGRALMPCALLLAIAACSPVEGSSIPSPVSPTPSIVVAPSQTATKAAKDCADSTVQLPAASETDSVQLTVSTDPSRTSLLVKNTGNLSVIVIPDENFSSRLIAAPYASPNDAASRVALIAVNNSGGARAVRGIPAYVPRTQVVTLPPQWAVCALTDDVKQPAGVRYIQDRSSSAEYLVTKGLADQLLVKYSSVRTQQTLIRCAKTTLSVLKTNPKLSDIELYAKILSPGAACRAGYKALAQGDEQATERLETTVLGQLAGAPHLLDNSALLSATALP